MIEVLDPGLLTTVQDGGRHGYGHLGVPSAGAADPLNLAIANRLVGNPPLAPALEMTLHGASLRFTAAARVALTGAAAAASLDDSPVAQYQTLPVPAGAVLRVGALSRGLRAYLAVAGGLDVPCTLGSASTDTLSGLGPPPLRRGDRLALASGSGDEALYYWRFAPALDEAPLRVIAGPHSEWFEPEAQRRLYHAEFRVSGASDRSGLRLEGPALARAAAEELPSAGMVTGAIQVPPDGQPIVLLPNHGSTGGYPVIATVISADLWRLGQLPPGARLRFCGVALAQARAALAERQRYLREALVPADAGLLAARALMMFGREHPALREARMRDGERRLRFRRGTGG